METKIKCTHPDHVEGESCEDRAVGCHPNCECCMGNYTAEKNLIGWAKKDIENRKKINRLRTQLRITYNFIKAYSTVKKKNKVILENEFNFPEEMLEEIRKVLTDIK